jgi:type II secretory pathway pseudopilin PulG
MERTVLKTDKGLTLVEVLLSTVITLVLFLALMQSALLSIEMNTKNSLRTEAVGIAEERMRIARNLPNETAFNDLATDTADAALASADCPASFVTDFGTTGMLVKRNLKNIAGHDLCTNRTVTMLTNDNRYKRVAITVGWKWKDEPATHVISSIVRMP